MGKPLFVLIAFEHGRRIEKLTRDVRGAMVVAEQLREKGIKAHVASRNGMGLKHYPVGRPEDESQLWCPYCRRWRWFKIPSLKRHVEIGSTEWMLNSFHNQEIRICAWCCISELDFHVKRANGLSDLQGKRRRNRSKRRRRIR